MEKSENAVRSRLLEAGKEEFRDRGFLKASLRAICKKADVTTGALYFFFESKAALFEEIVEETVEDLKRIMGDFTDQEKQLHPEEYDRILMEFIWENRDKLEIINQGNTAFFESFRKMLVDMVKLSLNKLIINRYPTLLTKIKNPNFFSTIAAGFLHCLNMVALNGEDYETQKRNVKELVVFFFERMEERFENF